MHGAICGHNLVSNQSLLSGHMSTGLNTSILVVSIKTLRIVDVVWVQLQQCSVAAVRMLAFVYDHVPGPGEGVDGPHHIRVDDRFVAHSWRSRSKGVISGIASNK